MSADGWPSRENGTCDITRNEVDCGSGVDKFHRCCPLGSICGNFHFANVGLTTICCDQSNQSCNGTVINSGPFCANPSWILYQNPNDGGFFCCLPGTEGYTTNNGTAVRCADPGYVLKTNEAYLSVAATKTNRKIFRLYILSISC
jgi:hypothetical protein